MLRRSLLLFTILLVLPLVLAASWSTKASAAQPYTVCSDNTPGARFQLTNLTYAPDPLVMGKHLTAKLDGVLGEDVTSGKIKIDVKLGPVLVQTIDLDLCDTLPDLGTACPLKKGPITLIKDADLPELPFAGTVTLNVKLYDQDDNEGLCVNLKLKILKSS